MKLTQDNIKVGMIVRHTAAAGSRTFSIISVIKHSKGLDIKIQELNVLEDQVFHNIDIDYLTLIPLPLTQDQKNNLQVAIDNLNQIS